MENASSGVFVSDWLYILVAFAAGAAGYAIYKWFKPGKRNDDPSQGELLLNKWFGPTARATQYTFDEVTEWVAAYESLLKKGYKALIFKANNKVLANLTRGTGVNFGSEKFLVLILVSADWTSGSGSFKKIYRSSLVKYDTLDQRLEDELSENDGVMKIGE